LLPLSARFPFGLGRFNAPFSLLALLTFSEYFSLCRHASAHSARSVVRFCHIAKHRRTTTPRRSNARARASRPSSVVSTARAFPFPLMSPLMRSDSSGASTTAWVSV
jgi:hypothetical protein